MASTTVGRRRSDSTAVHTGESFIIRRASNDLLLCRIPEECFRKATYNVEMISDGFVPSPRTPSLNDSNSKRILFRNFQIDLELNLHDFMSAFFSGFGNQNRLYGPETQSTFPVVKPLLTQFH